MTSSATPSDFDLVERVASSGGGIRQGMQELLSASEARLPHTVWQPLRGLELERDVVMLREWLERLLDLEPVPEQVNGLYFGLAGYADGDRNHLPCPSRSTPTMSTLEPSTSTTRRRPP